MLRGVEKGTLTGLAECHFLDLGVSLDPLGTILEIQVETKRKVKGEEGSPKPPLAAGCGGHWDCGCTWLATHHLGHFWV